MSIGPDPLSLFSQYLEVTGVPTLKDADAGDEGLRGATLGILNGSSWITLWSNWFGRRYLRGVRLVNTGNEAVQLSFMSAHHAGRPVPPRANIDAFVSMAKDLRALYRVDAILITCSTMNRAHQAVRDAVPGVPVVQIDEPMMEKAVGVGERVLVIATHGPTVDNTRSLLEETAARLGRRVSVGGAVVEEAFRLLGAGDVVGHNDAIARVIRAELSARRYDVVVLAQLSMSTLVWSYPDRVSVFGLPVLVSGEEGFLRVRELLLARQNV